MPIEQFTRAEFEAALPVNADGEPLWESLGLIEGEYMYAVPIIRQDGRAVRIVIRSSIRPDGKAADVGEDSIRVWLEGMDGSGIWNSLGKAGGRYITRVPGWARRLTGRDESGELVDSDAPLRRLYRIGLRVKMCPICTRFQRIYTVKKDGPNKGRLFQNCGPCKGWGIFSPQWLD